MAGIGSVLSLAGTVASAAGTLAAGASRRRALQRGAAEAEVQADAANAEAGRDAARLGRERQRALSRIQALQAASGFAASDPTGLRLVAERDLKGRFDERMARRAGKARARALRADAAGARDDAGFALGKAVLGATGTVLGGASSLFRRYG